MRRMLAALAVSLFFITPAFVTPASSTIVSWYDCATPGQCSKSKRTASGERFNKNALTAAHRTLPFGTIVAVTHKGRTVHVRINDRGPFIKGRTIDLSKAAARRIGCTGTCKVSIKVVSRGGSSKKKKN